MSSLTGEFPFSLQTAHGILRGWQQETGSGPIGVFIHGFRSHCGGAKARALARHAQTHAYSWLRLDLRGHGQSDGDFSTFSLSGLGQDLEAVLAHLSPRPVVLVGSSMGAWLAVLGARQQQHASNSQIQGLVLIAPGFNFMQSYAANLTPAELRQWQCAGTRVCTSAAEPDAYILNYAAVTDAAQFDVLSAPLTLSCAVILIHGENDAVAPVSLSQRFARLLTAPYKRLQIIPGGDHRLLAGLPEIYQAVDQIWLSLAKG